jgi:hypothetical protein
MHISPTFKRFTVSPEFYVKKYIFSTHYKGTLMQKTRHPYCFAIKFYYIKYKTHQKNYSAKTGMFHSWDNGVILLTFPYWRYVTGNNNNNKNNPARICPMSHEQELWCLLRISTSPGLVLLQRYFKALLATNYSLINPNTKKPWNLALSSLLCYIAYCV